MSRGYQSQNPVLNNRFMANFVVNERMTYSGTMQKIGGLLGLTTLTALAAMVVCWTAPAELSMTYASLFSLAGFGLGFVLAVVIGFVRPQNPAALIGLYAVLEGMALGGASYMFESYYEGIVFQALFGTVGITATMYVLYSSRLLRPTPTFNKIVFGLMSSITLLYLVSFVMSIGFGVSVPFLHTAGPVGIAVTVFILVVASLTLISNFGFIESGVQYGAPKQMEWYAAFGILISLIWIYLETLRLLSKIQTFLRD